MVLVIKLLAKKFMAVQSLLTDPSEVILELDVPTLGTGVLS